MEVRIILTLTYQQSEFEKARISILTLPTVGGQTTDFAGPTQMSWASDFSTLS
jgi:hypothetical protein